MIDSSKNRADWKGFISKLQIKENKQADIFMYIIENTNPENNVFLGTYKKIAADVKCSETTIAKIMKRLQECNYISKIQNGAWYVNISMLNKNLLPDTYLQNKTEDELLVDDYSFLEKYPRIDYKAQVNKNNASQSSFNDINENNDNFYSYNSKKQISMDNRQIINFKRPSMTQPIIEACGDEMANIIFYMVKDNLLIPFVDLDLDAYDLSIKSRDISNNKVVDLYQEALKKNKVSIKCSNLDIKSLKIEDFDLKNLSNNPFEYNNSSSQGVIFYSQIIFSNTKTKINNWNKSIVLSEVSIDSEQLARANVFDKQNIEINYSNVCFKYALEQKQDVWFILDETKNTKEEDVIYKTYELYYRDSFEKAGLKCNYLNSADAINEVVNSSGGFIWITRISGRDLIHDLIKASFNNKIMTQVTFVTFDNCYEFKTDHGVIHEHFLKYNKGTDAYANPIPTIFAWSAALRRRGQLDSNQDLIDFSFRIEHAVDLVIKEGFITKDLVEFVNIDNPKVLNSKNFIFAVKDKLGDVTEGDYINKTAEEYVNEIVDETPDYFDNPTAVSYYNEFKDNSDIKTKIKLLLQMKPYVTEKMVDDLAISLNITLLRNDTEGKYQEFLLRLIDMDRFS